MEPIRRILVAVDLTPRSKVVLDAACRVARDPATSVVLLHVVGDLEATFDSYGANRSFGQLQTELEEKARARLGELRGERLRDYAAVELEVRVGPPWSEIVAAALHHRVELVFLGAHFSDEPRHKLQGDTVGKVTRFAPCPLVVVPSTPIG